MTSLLIETTRKSIKLTAQSLMQIKGDIISSEPNNIENRSEVIANIILAYRHLEDASMRLGKALQDQDGGVSVYDKRTVVDTPEPEYDTECEAENERPKN